MANSTFLELTNKLLKRFNEVTISQSDFASVTGIHATAKDMINDSLREILHEQHQWSFNAVEQTDTLVAGTFEYAWPSDYKDAEWGSFQIQADDSLSVGTTVLERIDRTEFYRKWYDDAREGVDDSNYRAVPKYVFQTHGQGFGLYPNPDAAYEIKYRYYKNFTALDAYDDETTVPQEFDHVIIYCGMKHMNLFLDNYEQANYCDKELFKPALKSMRTLLINDDFVMNDTRRRKVNG